MTSWHGSLVIPVAAALLLACGDSEARKVTDRFLTALQNKNYDAAHVELHSDAKKHVPTPAALRAIIEKRGKFVTSWSRNCGSGSKSVDRGGFNYSATTPSIFDSNETVTIGVEPQRVGKCNGPMVVELHVEAGAWKIRSYRY